MFMGMFISTKTFKLLFPLMKTFQQEWNLKRLKFESSFIDSKEKKINDNLLSGCLQKPKKWTKANGKHENY